MLTSTTASTTLSLTTSSLHSRRSSKSSRIAVSSLSSPYSNLTAGLSSNANGLRLRIQDKDSYPGNPRDAVIEAKRGNPPVMPAVMTPVGPVDLSTIMFRNRIIFIGQPINSQVAQRVISQLVTLASIDENADILMYLNCPGGSTYSILAIYDCMSWIKPKVGTICFGVAASQGALLLAGGEKGMRYAMPNARIMIHQPQSGCGGHVEDVRRQVNEAVQSRHKIDKMFSAFTGQPLEKVQQYTERDRFLSVSEVRMKLVKNWLPVLIVCKDNMSSMMPHKSMYVELEETFLKIISPLPMSDAQELLKECLNFSTRNVDDCPHLITAFKTWFRRATRAPVSENH